MKINKKENPKGIEELNPISFRVKTRADDGNRTHVSSLEGWGNSHYTTSAKNIDKQYQKVGKKSIHLETLIYA